MKTGISFRGKWFSALLLALALPLIDSPSRADTVAEFTTAAPTLGNYPKKSLSLSADTTVTPDAAPTNTTRLNVSTSTNFKGSLEGAPATGVVRVTDAHPAGTYTVTVRAFDSGGASASKTFTLTVTTPTTCNPVSFAPATNRATGSGSFSVAIGDFNRDGKQDLASLNYASAGSVSIYLGDGAGGFSPPTNYPVGSLSFCVAVGDFNGDGKQDLAIANPSFGGSNNLGVLLGNGNGTFNSATYFIAHDGPGSVVVADFNGDGRQDLAATNFFSGDISILLGNGQGSFSAPTNYPVAVGCRLIVSGDFNGDNNADLVTVTQGFPGKVWVLLGDGTGDFSGPTQFNAANSSQSVATGDFNGDGKQDLVVSNYESRAVSLLLGDGNGTFASPVSFGSGGGAYFSAVGDFNGDGKQDLAVANDNSSDVSILLGDGTGNFGPPRSFAVGGGTSSVAVGDFNADGKQDLATSIDGGGSNNLSILLRDCPLAPTSALSRMTHGGAGNFDIDLPLSGLPGSLGVECRTTGATNDHQLVVSYPGTVTVNGNPQAQVTSGSGVIGSSGASNGGTVMVSGNTVTIPLTNVTNAQVVNVSLNGVNAAGNLVIPMGVLAGDVNGSHGVNATDVSVAKTAVGQAVDATNFRTDVTANGTTSSSDVSLVKSTSGSVIP